ncbi:MAG: hypothetical protein ACJAZ3_000397 [Sphingobacteriales bacterium]
MFSTLKKNSDSTSVVDTTNQKQTSSTSNKELNLYASYTEPIAKKSFISASMAYFNRLGDNNKEFRNVFANSEQVNNALSTEYQNSYIYYRPSLNYKFNGQRLTLNTGVGFQQSELRGTFSDTSFVIEKSAFDLLPTATASYQLAKRSKLRLNYNTSVTEPSMSQLQPVINNSNPLYIYVVNQDFQRQYANSIRLNYNYYSEFSETSVYTYLNSTITQNNIVNSITTTNGFAQIVTPINLGTQEYSSAYIHFSRPLKPVGIKVNATVNGSITNQKSLVNAIENKTTTEAASVTAGIGNYKKEKISLYTSFSPSLTNTMYSINVDQNRQYFIYKYSASFELNAIKKWTFSTNLNYDIYTKEAFGTETRVPILTASISRTFLKNDRGELKVRVFDALDKNQGVTRDNGANYISETVTNSLGRTFMLSFSYNLSKLGNTEKKGGFMHF